MDGFLIDSSFASAFDGIASVHNGLARHFGELCSKMETQIQNLSLQHEQAQARANVQGVLPRLETSQGIGNVM